MSRIAKRYLLIGGVFAVVGVGLIIGAIRPYKHALGRRLRLPTVEVVQVQQEDVPIYAEWIGTLDGFSQRRRQGAGDRVPAEAGLSGRFVRQDKASSCFRSTHALFRQRSTRPKASWLRRKPSSPTQQAVQRRTELDVERYTPLAKEQAASQQDLDNAVQNNLAALASVETAKAQIKTYEAAVETAKINLEFTRLVAPIDGIAGQAQLQVGALVSPASGRGHVRFYGGPDQSLFHRE